MSRPIWTDIRERRDAIWAKILDNVDINPETGCWLWRGGDSGDGKGGGYARMRLDGQTVAVHIVTFTHENGYVPWGKHLDHLCVVYYANPRDARRCVNPEHLELTTPKRNNKRRLDRSKTDGEVDIRDSVAV